VKKITIQSLYFQVVYLEVEVPNNLSADDAEDWAHDKVHEITEKLSVQSSLSSIETEGVKLLLEKKIDHETQTCTQAEMNQILKGE